MLDGTITQVRGKIFGQGCKKGASLALAG